MLQKIILRAHSGTTFNPYADPYANNFCTMFMSFLRTYRAKSLRRGFGESNTHFLYLDPLEKRWEEIIIYHRLDVVDVNILLHHFTNAID